MNALYASNRRPDQERAGRVGQTNQPSRFRRLAVIGNCVGRGLATPTTSSYVSAGSKQFGPRGALIERSDGPAQYWERTDG